MMLNEFETLTGIYPDYFMYQAIEELYIEMDEDKRAFCNKFKANKDGLAEKAQHRAAEKYRRFEDKLKHEVYAAQNAVEEMKKTNGAEISRLKAALDKELDWHPYEDSHNVKQADYEKLAVGAETGRCSHYMTDDEAKTWICDEYDFNPDKITIIHEIDEEEVNRHGQLRKTGKKIDRRPVYCATDYHYIRFNTSRFFYEVWNGQLRPFYD